MRDDDGKAPHTRPPHDPPAPPVADVWRADHVFITTPSSWPIENGRAEARHEGFSTLLVQLAHTGDLDRNVRQVVEHGPSLRREGWKVAGWGTFGQGTDPREDGLAAARLAAKLELAGWMGNGENWAEGREGRWKSVAFMDGWHAGGAPCPIGVSCNGSTTDNFARDFDYETWLEQPGAVIAPQVYGNLNPALKWQSTLASLTKAGVPADRITMTFGTYVDKRLGLAVPFEDYLSWGGLRGCYLGERTAPGGWAQLRRS